MDLEPSLESSCHLSGVLSFILHLSRFAGVAPIKFERVPGGWRTSLSWFYYAYDFLIMILIRINEGYPTFDPRAEFIDGYEPESNTQFMGIMTTVFYTIETTICVILSLTSYSRFQHMIHCIARLEQINKELDCLTCPSSTSEIKIFFKVLFLLIHGYIGSFTEYVIYLYDVDTGNDKVPLQSICFVAVYFSVCQLHLLTVQFNLIVMRLVTTQRRLNSCLKSLVDELRNDVVRSSLQVSTNEVKNNCEVKFRIENNFVHQSTFNTSSSTLGKGSNINPEMIRQLINIYCSLCNMIKVLNDCNGPFMMFMLLYSGVYMITAPYFIVTILYRTQSEVPIVRGISVVLWCTLCFGMILMLTEPCQKVHYQLFLTKKLINKLLSLTPTESSDVYYQLKMFKKHIFLNPVTFSPLRLLKFDRNLSVAVLSTSVTYLSVVMNL